jgi:hypothetical protein
VKAGELDYWKVEAMEVLLENLTVASKDYWWVHLLVRLMVEKLVLN